MTGSAQLVSPSIRWAELTRPNEALAAFTVTWHDSLNRIGLLEPGGTHPDHRRRGLGEALVLHAMHRMMAAGMTHATVADTGTSEASRALYAACGFTPWHLIDDFVKPAPIRGGELGA